jgi:hypothetical protein
MLRLNPYVFALSAYSLSSKGEGGKDWEVRRSAVNPGNNRDAIQIERMDLGLSYQGTTTALSNEARIGNPIARGSVCAYLISCETLCSLEGCSSLLLDARCGRAITMPHIRTITAGARRNAGHIRAGRQNSTAPMKITGD